MCPHRGPAERFARCRAQTPSPSGNASATDSTCDWETASTYSYITLLSWVHWATRSVHRSADAPAAHSRVVHTSSRLAARERKLAAALVVALLSAQQIEGAVAHCRVDLSKMAQRSSALAVASPGGEAGCSESPVLPPRRDSLLVSARTAARNRWDGRWTSAGRQEADAWSRDESSCYWRPESTRQSSGAIARAHYSQVPWDIEDFSDTLTIYSMLHLRSSPS